MRARTNVPLKERKTLVLSDFKGVDFSSSPLNVQKNRASFARNFINENGVNKKRNGWKLVWNFGEQINGIFKYSRENYKRIILYAGTSFYEIDEEKNSTIILPKDANGNVLDESHLVDERIQFFLNRERVYITGCGDYLVYGTWDNGETYELRKVLDDEDTYIPTTTISIDDDTVEDTARATLDDVNCLSSRRKNQLLGVSQLTWGLENDIDNTAPVTVCFDKTVHVSNRVIDSKYGEFLYDDNGVEYGKIGFLNNTITLKFKGPYHSIGVTYKTSEGAEQTERLNFEIPSATWTLDASIDAGTLVEIRLETLEDGDAVTYTIKNKKNDDKLYDNKLYKVTKEDGTENYEECGSITRGGENEKGKIELKCLTVPQIENKDNIFVTFYHANNEYTDRITKCRFGTLFGVDGNTDRIFLSGNPSMKNYDFYSEEGDFTYFSDKNFAALGTDSSAIVGYSRLSDSTLAIYKDGILCDAGIFYRMGQYEKKYDSDGNIVSRHGIFYTRAGSAGEKCVSTYACVNFAGDSLMLSENGVFGIVLSNNVATSERYARERSRPINEHLKKHDDLSDAVGIAYKNRYYLSVGGDCYVADARFRTYEEGNLENAFNYEWWYWDNVPARVWAEIDGDLYFGTSNGNICVFDDKYSDRDLTLVEEGDLSVNVGESKITYSDNVSDLIKEGARIVFNRYNRIYSIVLDEAKVENGLIYDPGENIHSIREDMVVYADKVGESGLSLNEKYHIIDIDLGNCTYSLKQENGEKIYLNSGGFRLCSLITGEGLYIANVDVENKTFQLKRYADDENTLALADYEDSALQEAVIAWCDCSKNVVAEFYTPIFDLGTNASSKTLLKMTISTEPETDGKITFGYETRNVKKLLNTKGINTFSFEKFSFESFSFETGFSNSYSVKCNERNFNFIIFRFLSDSNKNCAVNSFTALYKINKPNQGVK